MKKITIFLAIFVVLCLFAACNGDDEASSAEPSSAVESSQSQAQSSEEASEVIITSEIVESSDESEEQSTEISEESSAPPTTEESSQEPSVIGEYAKPYMDIIKTGSYYIKTTESRLIGGEAPPYITEMYAKNNVYYALITESYGATSTLLIKDGNIYWLDTGTKTATVMPFDRELFDPDSLWSGDISLIDSGVVQLGMDETEYNYETYRDEQGKEFTLLFNGIYLLKYRSFDEKQGDEITIDIEINNQISQAIFDIPEGYQYQ